MTKSTSNTNTNTTNSLLDVKVTIIQQPQIARMSGINESKTRRILDPPLVLHLDLPTNQSFTTTNYIAKTNLFTEDGRNADYLIDKKNDTRIVNLSGSIVTTPRLLYHTPEMNQKKWFFVFAKLSIRQAGRYYITITITKIGVENTIELMTEIFEVVPPHLYKGNSGKPEMIYIL
jgi:Velvet factor